MVITKRDFLNAFIRTRENVKLYYVIILLLYYGYVYLLSNLKLNKWLNAKNAK